MTTPSEQEEKWFKEQELKNRQEKEVHASSKQEEAEREARRQAHYMKCPKCGSDLAEQDHEGVKVDVCTGCRGVWLDPGELEQLSSEKGASLFGFLRKR